MGVKIFISYSHKDELHKDSLEDHLSTLKTNGQIDTWNDRKLVPGENWANEISDNLKEAEIILFLMSVIVRPSDWTHSPFGTFQALPKDALPVTKWDDQDEAWLNVIQGIRKSIDALNDSKKKSQP